jgi:hypothetical protein
MKLYNIYSRTDHVEDGFTQYNSRPLSKEQAESWKQMFQKKYPKRKFFLREHRRKSALAYEQVSVC